jgi:hypothetical protein
MRLRDYLVIILLIVLFGLVGDISVKPYRILLDKKISALVRFHIRLP